MEKAGIDLRLGKKVSLEDLKALDSEALFLASGAQPFMPQVPGVHGAQVVSAESVLMGQSSPQGPVVVIGSGMTGLETAEVLALRGCQVTLVEMLDSLGRGVYPGIISDIMDRILPLGSQVLLGHRLTRIGDKEVELLRLADGEQVNIPMEWVVLAVGVTPRQDLAMACQGHFDHLVLVGDAARPGRILEAMQDAQAKAYVFELT